MARWHGAALGLALGFSRLMPFMPFMPSAQADPPPKPVTAGGSDSKNGDRLRTELFEQMRTMRMWKLTEELKLDEATAARLFPLLAKFDEQMRELGKERGEVYRTLSEEMKLATPDSNKLLSLVDRLSTNRAKRSTHEAERWVAIRKVLSPIQQAKMILLMPRMEEAFRHKIRESLGGAGGDNDSKEDRPRGPRGGFDGLRL